MIRVEVLKKGDKVLSVTSEFIAVQRKNGEVEVRNVGSSFSLLI